MVDIVGHRAGIGAGLHDKACEAETLHAPGLHDLEDLRQRPEARADQNHPSDHYSHKGR
jgi:hypothetical protein